MSEMGAVLEAGSACRRNLRFFDMIWAISPWQLFDGGSNVWSQLIQLSIAATRPRNRSTQAFADFESCKFGDLACTNRVEGAPAKARGSAVFLVENDGGESDPASHAKLKTVERYVAVAEERVAQLKDHLEHLRRIEAAVIPLPQGSDGAGEHAIERRAV
jgi:hypothetical protein